MIQYFHGTKLKGFEQEFTLAIEVPTKENLRIDVWKLLGDNITSIKLPIGIADVNPKDHYYKAIGREVSLSKIENVELYLDGIRIFDNGSKVVSLSDGGTIRIKLEIKQGRDKVHLLTATV